MSHIILSTKVLSNRKNEDPLHIPVLDTAPVKHVVDNQDLVYQQTIQLHPIERMYIQYTTD